MTLKCNVQCCLCLINHSTCLVVYHRSRVKVAIWSKLFFDPAVKLELISKICTIDRRDDFIDTLDKRRKDWCCCVVTCWYEGPRVQYGEVLYERRGAARREGAADVAEVGCTPEVTSPLTRARTCTRILHRQLHAATAVSLRSTLWTSFTLINWQREEDTHPPHCRRTPRAAENI